MKSIQVFDKPMCCSTGVCGPQVDPVLPRFAADLEWLRTLGVRVERFNLAHQPAEFAQNSNVHDLLTKQGTDCLPVIIVDGQVVSLGQYPPRDLLSQWTATTSAGIALPMASSGGPGCCDTGTC